jgi:glutamate/tyrosine decarboxylase-like PLP-dependent enzyme
MKGLASLMLWKQKTHKEIDKTIDKALQANLDLNNVIGHPSTKLNPVLSKRLTEYHHPWIKACLENANNIGCHTLEYSEEAFNGTQDLERQCIRICAEEIFAAESDTIDGYISTGGTESNLQALWSYRNYFKNVCGASMDKIAVLFSEDTHYSVPKACDILQITPIKLSVDTTTRMLCPSNVETVIDHLQQLGKEYFIWVANLGTTMFGSIDQIDPVVKVLSQRTQHFHIHIDAALGGFLYPFVRPEINEMTFENENISSFTLDAHKLMGAPYGSGIFLIRKGFLKHVSTKEAGYILGNDHTVCGSRSGANAVALWMILNQYGRSGWTSVCNELEDRTNYLCEQLDRLGIRYFRQDGMNVVAIKAQDVPKDLVKHYYLVPDDHRNPNWYKIVVMYHVDKKIINALIDHMS